MKPGKTGICQTVLMSPSAFQVISLEFSFSFQETNEIHSPERAQSFLSERNICFQFIVLDIGRDSGARKNKGIYLMFKTDCVGSAQCNSNRVFWLENRDAMQNNVLIVHILYSTTCLWYLTLYESASSASFKCQ